MKAWKVFTVFVKDFWVQQRNVKIKMYVNFYSLSGIGKLRVKKNFMAPFFWLESITNYKTGLRSVGHLKNMFVLKEKGISFLFHF